MTVRLITYLGVALVAALAAGCATTGYQRADRAVASMTGTRDELSRGTEQVTRTLDALNTLIGAAEGDLRPLYKAFDREVAAMQRNAQSARGRAEAMSQNAANYLDAWGEQIETIQGEDVRSRSMQRREEAKASFARLKDLAQQALEAYEPLLADLADIQSHLGQDLTARGIAGTRDFVVKAEKDASSLQQKLNGLVAEIDRVISEIDAKAETGN